MRRIKGKLKTLPQKKADSAKTTSEDVHAAPSASVASAVPDGTSDVGRSTPEQSTPADTTQTSNKKSTVSTQIDRSKLDDQSMKVSLWDQAMASLVPKNKHLVDVSQGPAFDLPICMFSQVKNSL